MSPETQIRVMLVDDHSIMRDGLQEVLERTGKFQIVGQASDGEEAVRKVEDLKPDVIIMDVLMPGKDGIDACREIMNKLPDTRVLMLTASNDEDAIIQSVAAGATGYLQKYSGKEKLLETIREVAEGEFRILGNSARRAFAQIRNVTHRSDAAEIEKLNGREREILILFSQGMSYADIAEVRGKSPLTIRNTIYSIQNKLGLRTKQSIVVWAVRNGLLDDSTTLS